MTVRVEKTKMIGTNQITLTAWRLEPMMSPHSHHTIRHFDDTPGRWWGRIGTESHLPAEIEGLPLSDDRSIAVSYFYASKQEEAYAYIFASIPSLVCMRPTISGGSVYYCEEDDDRTQEEKEIDIAIGQMRMKRLSSR